MAKDKPNAYTATEYPGVYVRGDSVCYRYRPTPGGRTKTVTLKNTTPKDAWLERVRVMDRIKKIRSGEIDPQLETVKQHAKRPIDDHLTDYEKHLLDKGDDPGHVRSTLAHIRGWLDGCSIETLAGADPDGWYSWTMEQRTGKGKLWSARTRNANRQAVAGFYRWAASRNRIRSNPMARDLMPVADAKHRRVNESRVFTPDEFWKKLLPAVTIERQAVYMLKACAGLRGREIDRIERRDLDLDEGVLIIQPTTGRKASKGRETADDVELPLAVALIDKLRELIDATGWTRGPIPVRDPNRRQWIADLVKAGLVQFNEKRIKAKKITGVNRYDLENLIGYADEDGRVYDRKSLRRTYITWLMHAGVDIREAQRLARHSSIELTANVYTSHELPRLRRAVDAAASLSARSLRAADASSGVEMRQDAHGHGKHAAG